jgi:hypothetical protein
MAAAAALFEIVASTAALRKKISATRNLKSESAGKVRS